MLAEYAMRTYEFGDLACAHITFSPNRRYVAFSTLEKSAEQFDTGDSFEVAYLFNRSTGSEERLYPSKYGFITEFQWSANGLLVVSDTNIDGCGGVSLVLDPASGQVLETVNGLLRGESWNHSRTAAFFVSHCWGAEPATDELAVYDFALRRVLSHLTHEGEMTGMRFTQGPTWYSGDSRLAVTIREGHWEDDFMNYPLTNAYVVTVELSSSGPKAESKYFDPNLDYSFSVSPDGEISVSSVPTQTIDGVATWY